MNKNKKTKAVLTKEEEMRRKVQAKMGFLTLYNQWLAKGKPSI